MRQESAKKCVRDQAEDEVTAEFAVVLEGKACEPDRPGRPAFGDALCA